MQTTLLGIAIALILALIAALVGPAFVNWNAHRAFFEAEATRLIGMPVHVTGAIDVSILPTPSITLRGIAIGEQGEASRLRAGALGFALGLGPLMRGEIRATEARLVGPELKLGLDRTGGVDWPNVTMRLKGETLSIERLSIDEGRIILVDATTGARLVLDKLKFKGEVRSLIGPFHGDGTFVIADGRYGYRISTSRFGDEGLKVKLALDLSDRPLAVEAEGALGFDYGAPRFEGNIMVARPVGAVLASGKAAVNEPWRATTRIKATPAGVMFDQVEFQYGPEDRAMKLTGTAEAKFGEQPRLQGIFSARHLDLDRLIAKPDMMRRLPFAAVKSIAEMFGDTLQPALPTRIAINVDTVTLGGATLQAVAGDLSSRGDVWDLDKLEFRAPGFTQVRANGRIELTAKGLGFSGLANVNATDSMTLLAWLTGRGNPAPGLLKAWHAHGNVTLTNDRIAVEQLRTEFDRATLEGRFAYVFSSGDHPAQLKAELGAAELDIDAWLQVAETMFTGLALERPREVELALDINKTRIVGIDTRKAAVNLKLDGNGLDLKRLSVDGFGNTSFEASGRIETQSSSPRGNIRLDLDARDLGGVIALAEKYAPSIVDPLRRLAGRQPAAKLQANIGVESSGPDAATRRTTAKIALEGQIGAFRVNVAGGAAGDTGSFSLADIAAFATGDLRFEGQLDAEDGAALLALLGLDRILVTEKRPGRMKLTASGPLKRDFRIDGRLTAGPIDINGTGTANLFGNQPAAAKFSQVYGTVGGSKVQGKLAVTFGAPMRIEGAIEADRLDMPAAFASVAGMPVQQIKMGEGGRETWSVEPFTRSASTLAGRIDIKAARAVLSGKLVAQSLIGALQFGASKVALEISDGELAGGRLTGDIAFFSSTDGLSALSYVELIGAKAAGIIPNDGRPPITGKLSLQATVEGAGLTPAAFMGSLHGNGKITFENAEFAGLNPNVFDALTRAVDLGIQADPKQIKEFVATVLDNGRLAVTRAESKITFVGGQARLVSPRVEVKGAELAVAATVDLADSTIDATLTLSGPPAGDVAGRPAVSVALKGAFMTPRNTVSADTLAGWLALRSVERQSKRLETIEAARRAALAQPLADLPPPGFTPMAPAGRVGDEDDVNPPQMQSTNEPSAANPESTGGIIGTQQAPPLPPPIMIRPMTKMPDLPGVPRREGNAPLP